MMEIAAQLIRMLFEPRLYPQIAALLAEFSRSAASVLLTALWQGLMIAAFLGLCLRFAPRISAALRFVVLAAGFAAIVALPFLPAILHLIGREQAVSATASTPTATHFWLMLDARWSIALALAWAAASLWRAIDLAIHTVRLRLLWKSAVPVAKATVTLPQLRGRKAVELCATDALERPSVIGFLAPRILIPAWLLERLSEAELEQIVLHESEHLRRGDDWTNLLQKLSLVIFPLNPALLWMERRLCLEREMACDEGVVRRTRAPRAYAACLTSLAEHGLERRVHALSLGAWQRRPELARRVHSLLAKKPALKPAAAAGMAIFLGCGLIAGSAELSRCPQIIGFSATHTAAQENPRSRQSAQRPAKIVDAAFEGDRMLRPEMRLAPAAAQGHAIHATQLRAILPIASQNNRQQTEQPIKSEIRDTATHLAPSLAAQQRKPIEAAAQNASLRQKPAEEQAQGWVVMTTMWEQTESAPAEAVSDTASADAGDFADRQPAEGSARVTVTRLMWRVTPERSDAGSANGAKKAARQAAQQQPVQTLPAMPPAIVPVRGGWLILQL
ncbi:MAG TPA: M56 family metallopeptidase [Acidobacteriaceae bacterium]|nr:M56 family metallopeptidase [Acidobacteriaceae bacterium]